MNQFRKFMYGRYGFDRLTRDFVLLSMLFTLISSFTGFLPFYALGYIVLICALFRTFSKNIPKRSRENQIYIQMTSSLGKKLMNVKQILVGTKTHKYFRCNSCKQIIRVPRGKGNVCITCPKCKSEFVKRS